MAMTNFGTLNNPYYQEEMILRQRAEYEKQKYYAMQAQGMGLNPQQGQLGAYNEAPKPVPTATPPCKTLLLLNR